MQQEGEEINILSIQTLHQLLTICRSVISRQFEVLVNRLLETPAPRKPLLLIRVTARNIKTVFFWAFDKLHTVCHLLNQLSLYETTYWLKRHIRSHSPPHPPFTLPQILHPPT